MQNRVYTPQEIGWLAGVFEGEGTTFLSRGQNRTGLKVCICMTDKDVIDRVHLLFPGKLAQRKRHENRKRQYEWRLSDRESAAAFLSLILPLLGKRRQVQARKVLQHATDPKAGLGSGHRNKTLCKRGHPFDAENTSVDVHGWRSCKACGREDARRRRAAARSRSLQL